MVPMAIQECIINDTWPPFNAANMLLQWITSNASITWLYVLGRDARSQTCTYVTIKFTILYLYEQSLNYKQLTALSHQ